MTATATMASTDDAPRQLPAVVAAAGSYLRTDDGCVVLDGCSGAVNVNLGHAHPRVLAACAAQMASVSFVYRSHFETTAVRRLRRRIEELTGGAYPFSLFTNSGSEAVEQALRLVWRLHEAAGRRARDVVLAEMPSYHGMTTGALAVSGHPPRREAAFPQWLAALQTHVQFVHAPGDAGARADAATWRAAIARAGDRLAAVIVEPIGGASSGAAAASAAALQEIRRATRAVDAFVISDEVMTGFGRSGQWSPSLARGLDADIVVASKGLGAGYHPIGAVLVAGSAMAVADLPDGATFGHTMAGNPVAAAVANAVLDELEQEALLSRVADHAPVLAGLLADVARDSDSLGPPRGDGLLFALPVRPPALHRAGSWRACGQECLERGAPGLLLAESVEDQQEHDAAALTATRAFAACSLAAGLLLYPAGINCSTASVLVAPPLNSDTSTLEELADRLRSATRRFERTSAR